MAPRKFDCDFSRRQLLSVAATSFLGGAGFAQARSKPKLGVQVYTVRRDFAKNPLETFKRIAQIGYRYVELADTAGLDAKTMSTALASAGLSCPSMHVTIYDWRWKAQERMAYAKEIGCKYVILAWTLPEDRENYAKAAEELTAFGKIAKSYGLQFAYHHHDFEFQSNAKGEIGIDQYIRLTDKNLVQFEVDTYWAALKDRDPVQLIKSLGKRVNLLHLKDITASKTMTHVGGGILDFKTILNSLKTNEKTYVFVEHDNASDPWESIQAAYRHLTSDHIRLR